MRKLLHLSVLCLLACGVSYPLSSQGAPIFNNYLNELPTNNFNTTIGTQFTVGAQNLTVNSLGVYDAGADGLPLAVQVGIWNAGGTLVGSVTVPAGTAGTLTQDWRFAAVAPFTLLANTIYRIGAFEPNNVGANDPFGGTFGLGAGIASATFGSVFHTGPFGFPESQDGATNRVYANADVTVVGGGGGGTVPEPSTLLLIGIALAGLGLRRRR